MGLDMCPLPTHFYGPLTATYATCDGDSVFGGALLQIGPSSRKWRFKLMEAHAPTFYFTCQLSSEIKQKLLCCSRDNAVVVVP